MSKKHHQTPPSRTPGAPAPASPLPTPPPTPAAAPDANRIPPHRRCPLCWGVRQGVGTAYSTQAVGGGPKRRRYYRCTAALGTDPAGCGHTWSWEFLAVEMLAVQHQEAIVQIRG